MVYVGVIICILFITYGIFCPNLSDKSKNALFATGIIIGIFCIIGTLIG